MTVFVRPPRSRWAWRGVLPGKLATSVPHTLRWLMLGWALAVVALVGADYLALRLTRIPVEIRLTGTQVVIRADGQTLSAPLHTLPSGIELVSGNSVMREYQVDGTDNTNTLTETPAGTDALGTNAYFAFLNWMRSSDLYSRWVGLRQTDAAGKTFWRAESISSGRVYALRAVEPTTIFVALERPEAPATLTLVGTSGSLATLILDRNVRTLSLVADSAHGQPLTLRAAYFPNRPMAYLAEVLDTVLRVLIWAAVLVALEVALALGLGRLWNLHGLIAVPKARTPALAHAGLSGEGTNGVGLYAKGTALVAWTRAWTGARLALRRLGWCHVVAGCLLTLSLGFEIWIALAQFQAEPHILDASAYLFQAKIFASGQLSVPAPADLAAFQGPFMVTWNHRWFAQYPPATSALLALGMLVHAPWLVEPLLGTAALLGVYIIGGQLYNWRTALLAVGLLAISPFYAHQAASYLSHTVSVAAEVGYLVALLWFVRTHRARALALAGAALAVMFAARELDAVLLGVVSVAWVAWSERGAIVADWRRVLVGSASGAATLGIGLALYLAYNALQTGNPLLLPRTLFSPADRYGFGVGVGFYGAHTVAAGLVNLDQQLTSLLIDLFGWPFYVTLALIPLALLGKDSGRRWDRFMAVFAGVIVICQVGYFYHGIYLGPRYLFDTLPALALLSARGFAQVVVVGRRMLMWVGGISNGAHTVRMAGVAAGMLLGVVIAFGALFYWPRQLALYSDYSGLPASVPLDVGTVYRAHLRNALVLTDNWYVYNYVLWPLNTTALTGPVLYAYAPTSDDIDRLMAEYASRQVYELISDGRGGAQFVRLSR